MDKLFRKNVSEIYTDIRGSIEKKDYSKLLDYLILILFCSAVLFVVVYKVSINLDKFLFDTNIFVLSSRVKEQLPQILFYVLLSISFFKWILTIRTGNPKIEERGDKLSDDDSFQFSFRKVVYSIKKDTIYTLILIFLLFIFIVTKIPYWDISFTANHPIKYNTYVDAALSMLKNNDPFMIQRKYMHNPLTYSLGMGTQFGSLPLLEWILFCAYKIFGNVLCIEAITRLVMLILGSIALVSFYNLVQKLFDKRYALIAVFILTFNPIFNLSSFVTVYDIINFALTFLSFSILLSAFKKEDIKILFLSALTLGVGAAIKENILLWTLPFIFVLFFFNYKKSIKNFFSNIILFFLGVILPYIISMTTINYFPTKEPIYFICFFVLLILFVIVFLNIRKIGNFISNTVSKIVDFISNHKRLLWFIPVLIIVGVQAVYLTAISEEFLTDWRLIFNVDLYTRFLTEQIIPYFGRITFYLLLFSMPLFIYYNRERKHTIAVLAFLSGSLFYLVIASKALFFHSYYWLFILASMSVFISWGILFTSQHLYEKTIGKLYLILLLSVIFLYLSPSVKSKLNRESYEVYGIIDYINSLDIDEAEGVSFIDQADLSYITIKTSLYRVYDSRIFGYEEFRESVKEIGFTQTMDKYKILYIITSQDREPDYNLFANSFSIKELETVAYRRTDQIYTELYDVSAYYEDEAVRTKILLDNKVSMQFSLIKDLGYYKVYKLTEACFKTIIE